MKMQHLVVSAVATAGTAWLTGKVVKQLRLPGYTAPVISLIVGGFVNKALTSVR